MPRRAQQGPSRVQPGILTATWAAPSTPLFAMRTTRSRQSASTTPRSLCRSLPRLTTTPATPRHLSLLRSPRPSRQHRPRSPRLSLRPPAERRRPARSTTMQRTIAAPSTTAPRPSRRKRPELTTPTPSPSATRPTAPSSSSSTPPSEATTRLSRRYYAMPIQRHAGGWPGRERASGVH